jgi:hypothetical protein
LKKNASISILEILGDLMRGGRHSRGTVARTGLSLSTADVWLKQLLTIPGVRSVREGKTLWFEWRAPPPAKRGARGEKVDRRQVPFPWEERVP